MLEVAGHEARISHLSLEAQGIERLPTVHLGPAAAAIERRGMTSARGMLNRRKQEVNAKIDRLRTELDAAPLESPPKAPKPDVIPMGDTEAQKLDKQNRRAREADEELTKKRQAEEQQRQADQARALREAARRVAARANTSAPSTGPRPS
jgi:hypothetical protein